MKKFHKSGIADVVKLIRKYKNVDGHGNEQQVRLLLRFQQNPIFY